MAWNEFKIDGNKVVNNINGGRAGETAKNSSKSKILKSKEFENLIYIEIMGKPMFLIFDAREAFNYLSQVFIKISIF